MYFSNVYEYIICIIIEYTYMCVVKGSVRCKCEKIFGAQIGKMIEKDLCSLGCA